MAQLLVAGVALPSESWPLHAPLVAVAVAGVATSNNVPASGGTALVQPVLPAALSTQPPVAQFGQ